MKILMMCRRYDAEVKGGGGCLIEERGKEGGRVGEGVRRRGDIPLEEGDQHEGWLVVG